MVTVTLVRPRPRPDFLDEDRANAFTNLFAHASHLTGDVTTNKFEQFVTENRSTLAAIHKAIEYPMELPEASYHLENYDPQREVLAKRLASALIAEGQAAEEEKRYRAAADIYLDLIRMGEHLEHGAIFNFYGGCIIERSGLWPLESVLESFR
jgi:hypothetical protein